MTGEKMKIEVEISEDEIRNAVELKIRSAVSDQSNHWSVDDYIKTQVKAQWQTTVDSMILDMLNNSQLLREKIATELERKLRSQLAAAIKAVTGTRFTQ